MKAMLSWLKSEALFCVKLATAKEARKRAPPFLNVADTLAAVSHAKAGVR
jgi:hypothetical protein